MELFALRLIGTNSLMFVNKQVENGETTYTLTPQPYSQLWCTPHKELALQVISSTDSWFGGDSFETPYNFFVGKLEVVELEIKG